MRLKCLIACLFASLYWTPAYAYLGPGLGTGALAVILGIIGSVFLALFAIFWYPIKKFFKKDKSADANTVLPATQEALPEEQSDPNKETRGSDS